MDQLANSYTHLRFQPHLIGQFFNHPLSRFPNAFGAAAPPPPPPPQMINQPCEISLGTLNPDTVPPGGMIEGALMFGNKQPIMRITENPLAQLDDDDVEDVDEDDDELEEEPKDLNGLRHTHTHY